MFVCYTDFVAQIASSENRINRRSRNEIAQMDTDRSRGVVVLFAGALAFIAATFDPNQYKGQIADLVKKRPRERSASEGDSG